ncbi:uncharacterized protein LOC143922442 isoform X2 [Arctopsyche grandis]
MEGRCMSSKAPQPPLPRAPPPPQPPAPIAPEDLYDQLDDFDFSQQLRQLLETNETLRGEIQELKLEIRNVSEKCTRLEKENDTLQTNISTLYKTATAELQRKERMNNEIRAELDDLKIRQKLNPRNAWNTHTKPNPTNTVNITADKFPSNKASYQNQNIKTEPNPYKQTSESKPRYGERQPENKSKYTHDKYDRKRLRSPSPHRSNRRSPKRRYLEHDNRKSNRSRSGSKNRSERYYNKPSRSSERRTETVRRKSKEFTYKDYDNPSNCSPNYYNEVSKYQRSEPRIEDIRRQQYIENPKRREDYNLNENETKYQISTSDSRNQENFAENSHIMDGFKEEPVDYNYSDANLEYNYTDRYVKTEESESIDSKNECNAIESETNYAIRNDTMEFVHDQNISKPDYITLPISNLAICISKEKPNVSYDKSKKVKHKERNENVKKAARALETSQNKSEKDESIHKKIYESTESNPTDADQKIGKINDPYEKAASENDNLVPRESPVSVHTVADKTLTNTKSKNSDCSTKSHKYNNLELITLKCREDKSEKEPHVHDEKSPNESIKTASSQSQDSANEQEVCKPVLEIVSIQIEHDETYPTASSDDISTETDKSASIEQTDNLIDNIYGDISIEGNDPSEIILNSSASPIPPRTATEIEAKKDDMPDKTIESSSSNTTVEESSSETSAGSSMLSVSDKLDERDVSGIEDVNVDAMKPASDRLNETIKHTTVTSTKLDNNTIKFTVHRKRSRIIKK